MAQIVPGVGQHRLKAANELMFTLCSGVESCQAGGDGILNDLIKTGFKMQAIKFLQTALVTAE